MTRSVCWSFTSVPFTAGHPVLIVTCPRTIEALLNPFVQTDEEGNFGPYVDAALMTADADEAPGIFRGRTTHGPSLIRLEPFGHGVTHSAIDLSRKHTLTGPLFAEAMKELGAHHQKFPWLKPRVAKRGQSALGAMMEDVLGDEAALFKDVLGDEATAPTAAAPDFLGLAFPDDEASSYFLTVALNLAIRAAWLEAKLQVKTGQGYL